MRCSWLSGSRTIEMASGCLLYRQVVDVLVVPVQVLEVTTHASPLGTKSQFAARRSCGKSGELKREDVKALIWRRAC